jgi:hypothetical protein
MAPRDAKGVAWITIPRGEVLLLLLRQPRDTFALFASVVAVVFLWQPPRY